jgi:hypothetical protein
MSPPTINRCSRLRGGSNDRVTYSLVDFYSKFIRSANLNTVNKDEIQQEVIQLLINSHLDPMEVQINSDAFGGTLRITKSALKRLSVYISKQNRNDAAAKIQKWWRAQSRVQAWQLWKYISGLSSEYQDLINAKSTSPNVEDVEASFIAKLNTVETRQVCSQYMNHLTACQKNMRNMKVRSC